MYRDDFYSLDKFTALSFTAASVSSPMRCIQILRMNQPIKFGIKGSNSLVDHFTILSAVHTWEFVYDLVATGSNYQLH
jgi:hypothetical protein